MKRYIQTALVAASLIGAVPFMAFGDTNTVEKVDLSKPLTKAGEPWGAFKLLQCDGPSLPASPESNAYLAEFEKETGNKYHPCDFQGLMDQAQFLINTMIVLGVVGALIGFSYAGYLYITGVEKNINKAKDIFPKVAVGFILMLTAWFIVYQILDWLTGNASAYLGG